MNKQEFAIEVAIALKKLGYRKNGLYWFKSMEEYVLCVNVQGSQWDKHDYYVELGIARSNPDCKNPTVLHWSIRHRCNGASGELNIMPTEFLTELNKFCQSLKNSASVTEFLNQNHAVRVANQYFI